MQAEFRNLKMHLICVTLRLQSLSPKIRSTMSILCSRVSLDDYQLKVRNLLRNSKFRDIITELPKGEFVFPELDQKLTTEPFIQKGAPYEVKLKIPEPKPKPKKIGFWKWFFSTKVLPIENETKQQPTESNKEGTAKDDIEENINEDSQGDGLMSEGDIMFPEEF